jgi:hypothetical protein
MTWHTQNGDRILTGREAELFVVSMRMALEALEDDTLLTYDTVLNGANRSLLIRLFAYVSRALLIQTDMLPELNAWTEGAVGVLHREFAVSLEAELEEDSSDTDRYLLRQLLVDATASEVEPEDRVLVSSKDAVEWRFLLSLQADSILWDLDWEMATLLPEHTPGGYFGKFDPPITYDEALAELTRLCAYVQPRLRIFNPGLN